MSIRTGRVTVLLLAALVAARSSASAQQAAGAHAAAAHSPLRVRFAVIGDYGVSYQTEVAALVHGWNPDFVITTGDNNYVDGTAATIDPNIGQFWHDFIHPYAGAYGPGASTNRFFPSLGNHDWETPNATPYLDYFTLPGNERYYSFVRGPVRFFALDSDPHEPDGNGASSVQAAWLSSGLAAGGEPFQLVYFHHTAYSSGLHGSDPTLQWPFAAWGADAVLAGHDHHYERVVVDGFPYFTEGTGGASLYAIFDPIAGSQVRYGADYGAMLVEGDAELLTFRHVSTRGYVHDWFALRPTPVAYDVVTLVAGGSAWRYLDGGVEPAGAWTSLAFDDSTWASGPAQLGYGDGDEATVVGYGPDPSQKYVTTWFRRTFTVADPGALREVRLELLRDDGAIVHLNGVEVIRSNMPPPPTTGADLASTSISGGAENAFLATTLDPTVLVAGTNVLAVEIHQSAVTSSDISFDLRLLGLSDGARIVQRGSTWRYLDTGVAPSPSWTSAGFDDAAWSSGPAQLGYGDGDEATVVSYGADPSQKHTTTWFRRTFTVASPPAYDALVLRLLRDDGASVFLNGVEVFRQNLPYPAFDASSFAEQNIGGADETRWIETHVDPRLLVAGTNVLAVEIHQSSPTSSDVSFDLELAGL